MFTWLTTFCDWWVFPLRPHVLGFKPLRWAIWNLFYPDLLHKHRCSFSFECLEMLMVTSATGGQQPANSQPLGQHSEYFNHFAAFHWPGENSCLKVCAAGVNLPSGFMCFITCCECWDLWGLRRSRSIPHLIQYSVSCLKCFPARRLAFSSLAIHDQDLICYSVSKVT